MALASVSRSSLLQAHEVAKAGVGGKLGEALEPFAIGLLAQQPVLLLHRAVPPAPGSLARATVAHGVGDRQVAHPLVDRRARQCKALGDLVDGELALDAHLAGLLAYVGGMRHRTDVPVRLG
jgi:hypothetical protein